ncbi:ATP-grasp fold amidoligase family protein [Arthrobacter sp. MDT1-48-3]
MYPTGFKRARTESSFLSFVAAEFRQRGTERRSELAQKMISHPFVENLGMRVPQRLAVLDNLDSIRDLHLPETFVLKLASGWSSRGVMVLERTDAGRFFDHMGLQNLDVESIKKIQLERAESFESSAPQWIIEEKITPTVGVGPIPFDYKFYSFQGRVALVQQIDRNTNPVKMALFDGDFKPLRRDSDYLLADTGRAGIPLIPLHAAEMLWWAQRLSLEADSPFVRIDLLDSPEGPVFGEFTYSPGGTHRKTFVFSDETLDRFDRLMSNSAEVPDALSETPLEIRGSLERPDALAYRAWAGDSYAGGARGAERLHTFYKSLATASDEATPEYAWYRHLGARWAGLRDRLRLGKLG